MEATDSLYNTTRLRRQDRALPQEAADRLLREGEFGTLCLQDTAGGGYGVPLNYVWDGGNFLYMHCAPQGHKITCLTSAPRACFVIAGTTRILPEKFSTAYESVILHGEVRLVEDTAEKRAALSTLIQKLTPRETERGAQYIERAIDATAVLRFRIGHYCGKAHQSH